MTHGNGTFTVLSYDLQGRMLDKTLFAQDGITVMDERFYQYDADSNITARTGTPGEQRYAYDAVDRLVEQIIAGDKSIQYSYDLNGNRLTRTMASGTDSNEQTLSYQPDSNRLLEVNATELPNRATQSQQSWNYNQANRMHQYLQGGVISTQYIINSQGQRSHKIDTQTDAQTIYQYGLAGYQIIGESTTDTTNNSTGKDYIWLDGEPIAQIDMDNGIDTISYLHTDHLLTSRLATDSTGQIIWRWEGEAFGDVPPQEMSGVTINLRFPGQYYDKESGLFYNMFRDYNPATGRYVQSDLIGLDGGMNTYAYVLLNPNTLTDALGLQSDNPLPSPACIQGGMSCLCVIAPWACDIEPEDVINFLVTEVAEDCQIRCFVDCTISLIIGDARTKIIDAGLEESAKRIANKLVKAGATFGRKLIPYIGAISSINDVKCYAKCIIIVD